MDLQSGENASQHTLGDSQMITFLPVNQARSPESQRVRRGYQSCDNCREKKKRCEPAAEGESCWRCQLESKNCVTTYKRKRRKMRSAAGSIAQELENTPAEGAMEMDDPPQDTPSQRDIRPAGSDGNASTPSVALADLGRLPRVSNTKEQILSTNLLDARDALDLIAVAGSKDSAGEASLRLGDPHQNQNAGTHPQSASIRPAIAPVAAAWDHFFLVKRGIIRAHEAIEYLDFYFSQLWHLFPVIPQWYSSPDRYGLLVAEEPVLTISLMTIASRYHPLSGFNGQARSERIHWRTWPWVQRIFQSSIWGSSAMRRHGAIAALLLFIEWHPRAINSPEDLISDCGEMELFDPQTQPFEAESQSMAEPMETHRRLESSSIPERLNIVAAAYRSNKMSWMLLSTANALAQELGCFDEEQGLAQTRPKYGSGNSSVSLEWTRILCTFLCLSDEALALRLRLEPQLGSTRCMEMMDRLPPSLMVDGFLESTVDLATHMRKARELLHSWRRSEQGTGPAVPVPAWESFRRGLDRWERQRQFSRTDLSLRGACLDIEYYYVRLCGLSPAAHMFEKSTETDPPSSHTTPLSQFADAATKASVDMLELFMHHSASAVVFKYAAVKYWLYIFCASLYLLKATLSMEEQLDRTNPRIDLILRVVHAIRGNAPDDIHMAQRYAALLDIIVSAASRPFSTNISASGRLSPHQPGNSFLENNLLELADDWIYDSSFWDTLPDMVGLNSIPNLVTPCFE